MKRYTSNSIKHEQLAKLRQLRDEFVKREEHNERRRKALENAELSAALWDTYTTNVRPLRGKNLPR